jgi:UDP-glucose 4-epimerase
VRILITGGNGGVGRDLVPALLLRGHEVVVLDREVGALVPHPGLRIVRGLLEEPATVAEGCWGADAMVHLAWSFSDDPGYLLEHDLKVYPRQWSLTKARPARNHEKRWPQWPMPN